jgi:S-adenosylmethionine:diacylglycerol 3-amino-3-carboxypropyl transferase
MSTNQVSATISSTTKEQLDRFTEEFGLKKNFVVEQALLYFMASRRELPDEAFIPTRLVLDDDSFDKVVARLKADPSPTAALRELMRGGS